MTWAKMLEEEYRKIAEHNSLRGKTSGTDFPVVGRVRDKVAEDVGFGSGKQFDKAKYIHENADEEMIKKLDDGGKGCKNLQTLRLSGLINQNASSVGNPTNGRTDLTSDKILTQVDTRNTDCQISDTP